MKKKNGEKSVKKVTQKSHQKELNIIEGALRVFGEKGFESTTISEICKAAKISDTTMYEYFSSKEEVLFSIAKIYTKRLVEKTKKIAPYIHGAREKMRVLIQIYLEFYENNKLFTSVALLSLKGNRNFIHSEAYQVVREGARSYIDVIKEGMEEGVFREDINPYLTRNMVLGLIEHLTIEWLLLGRHDNLQEYRDAIFDMVMRVIEKNEPPRSIEIKLSHPDVES